MLCYAEGIRVLGDQSKAKNINQSRQTFAAVQRETQKRRNTKERSVASCNGMHASDHWKVWGTEVQTEDRPKRRSGTPPSHSNTTRSIPKILLSAARLDFQWRSWARSRFGCKFLFKILDLSKSCGIAFEDLVGLLATDLTVGGDI